jgi:hypothetical protein
MSMPIDLLSGSNEAINASSLMTISNTLTTVSGAHVDQPQPWLRN